MERKHKLRGAFYLRLSKDDDNQKESSSISNQRKLLQDYAEKPALISWRNSVMTVYPERPLTGRGLIS